MSDRRIFLWKWANSSSSCSLLEREIQKGQQFSFLGFLLKTRAGKQHLVNSSRLASWPEVESMQRLLHHILCCILLSARNSYGNNRNGVGLLAVGAA